MKQRKKSSKMRRIAASTLDRVIKNILGDTDNPAPVEAKKILKPRKQAKRNGHPVMATVSASS